MCSHANMRARALHSLLCLRDCSRIGATALFLGQGPQLEAHS